MSKAEPFTINSDHALVAYISYIRDVYEKEKYITCPAPRIGADRSITQNGLFYVWITQYAAHLFKIDKRNVNKDHIEGMKRTIKGEFYKHSDQRFMIHQIVNPRTGERKIDYTSSSTWKRGEMYDVLYWLQMKAAEDGLILESRGEFSKLKREQNQ